MLKRSLKTFLLSWPMPALLVWGLCWVGYSLLAQTGVPTLLAMSAVTVMGVVLSLHQSSRLRRLMMGLGFPVSLLASGLAAGLPTWAWLLPLGLLALTYPAHAWRDAPWFPTPTRALDALAELAPLQPGAAVLDAGCGSGHGLRALRRAYPLSTFVGIEWSPMLTLWSRLSCPWAKVQRGDMWSLAWESFDLVYMFQRPESMARAWAKARAEMAPGAWLVSLEFEVDELAPTAMFDTPNGKTVRLYRVPISTPR